MRSCPIKQCGRKFQNDQTMLEHVRRRHNDQYETIKLQITKSIIEKQHAQQQELNKLPKLAKIINSNNQSGESKSIGNTYAGIVNRRSQSKGKDKLSGKTNLSGIIHDSRQEVYESNKPQTGNSRGLRPSLTKKVSAPNLMDDKLLPSIETHKLKKNKLQFKPIRTPKQSQEEIIQKDKINATTQQNFYTTAPNFNKDYLKKDINQSKKKLLMRSKSKDGNKQKQKQKKIIIKSERDQKTVIINPKLQIKKVTQMPQKSTLNTNSSAIQIINTSVIQEKKNSKQVYRPTRKNIQRTDSSQQTINNNVEKQALKNQKKKQYISKDSNDSNNNQRILSLTASSPYLQNSIFSPSNFSSVEYLYLNDCNLQKIQLKNLSSLIEISCIRNRLKSMNFLSYEGNANIRKIHIDHNLLTSQQVFLPQRIKIWTASFNKINQDGIDNVIGQLEKCSDMQEIDLSFNGVRKALNYKVKLLSANTQANHYHSGKMKKIDGLKLTKMDWQIMQEYITMVNDQQGLIPLGYSQNQQKNNNNNKDRPTTAISTNMSNNSYISTDSYHYLSGNKTIDALHSQKKQFQKLIKTTTKQLQIIMKENKVLESQLTRLVEQQGSSGMYNNSNKEDKDNTSNPEELYNKLQRQCQCLEALSFLQYADEDQLVQMIKRKKIQIEAV